MRTLLAALFLGPGQDLLPQQGPRRAWEIVQEVWGQPSFGMLRITRLLLSLSVLLFPAIYVDWLVGSRSRSAIAVGREIYYATALAFLILTLFLDWGSSNLVIAVVIYLLADVLVHLAGQVLVWGHHSIDPARSVLLAVLNYFEMAVAFAIFYRHWDCLSIKAPSASQALYFSLVTGMTVGYGDIVPRGSMGQVIVMAQLATFFLFAAVLLNALLGRAGDTTPEHVG